MFNAPAAQLERHARIPGDHCLRGFDRSLENIADARAIAGIQLMPVEPVFGSGAHAALQDLGEPRGFVVMEPDVPVIIFVYRRGFERSSSHNIAYCSVATLL